MFTFYCEDVCPECQTDLCEPNTVKCNSIKCHVDKYGVLAESEVEDAQLCLNNIDPVTECSSCSTLLQAFPTKEES